MGKAGNRKFTAPIQPKVPEDSYLKGTNKTNKYAAVMSPLIYQRLILYQPRT